jgi:hypothetical protein
MERLYIRPATGTVRVLGLTSGFELNEREDGAGFERGEPTVVTAGDYRLRGFGSIGVSMSGRDEPDGPSAGAEIVAVEVDSRLIGVRSGAVQFESEIENQA